MNSMCLVVADSGRARFFTMQNRSSPIQEIKSMVHTEARLRELEMTRDLPGRHGGNGSGAGHAYQDKTSPKEQENINFAKAISSQLDELRKANKFKQIALVAAPKFLGDLRNQMNEQTQKLLCFELAKDLSSLDPKQIRKHLPERIPSNIDR